MSANTVSTFRKIHLTLVCTDRPKVIYDASSISYDDNELRSDDLPVLFLGETVIFCLTCLDQNGQAMCFSAGDSFSLSGDINFDHTDSLVIYASGSSSVNVAGDWSDADLTSGKISIRAVCGSSQSAGKLGTDEDRSVTVQVRRVISGSSDYSILMSQALTLKNIVQLNENAPAPAAVGYYTAEQVDSLLAGVMDEIYEVPDYQYSADGSTEWHAARVSTDFYYRTSADGIQWGPAIPMGRFGVIIDNVNHVFTTTEGQSAALTFTKTALGIASDSEPQLSLWNVQNGVKTLINTASYIAAWSSDSLSLTYYTTWPEGNWIIKMS